MSLIDLSNRTLSGCCVSFEMGLSYFFRLNPQETSSNTTKAIPATIGLVIRIYDDTLMTILEPHSQCGQAVATPHRRPWDSQCEKRTTRPQSIPHPHVPHPQRFLS